MTTPRRRRRARRARRPRAATTSPRPGRPYADDWKQCLALIPLGTSDAAKKKFSDRVKKLGEDWGKDALFDTLDARQRSLLWYAVDANDLYAVKIIIRKTTTDGLARHLSRNRESARKNPLTLARDREDLEHIRALLAAVPVMPPNLPPRVRSARAKSAQLEAALYGFDEEAKKSSARKQRKNSCARILHKTEIVMECLHRFCSECIQKCLRVGKNECPSCRIHVPSRGRPPDPNFRTLISKIYPDLGAFERYEERMIAAFNKQRAETRQDAVGDRRAVAARWQRALAQGRARAPPAPQPKRAAREAPPPPRAPKAQPNVVNFVLRVHPHETGVPGLAREYLSTSDQLKVQHLKKFLGMKLKYAPVDDFELLIALENQCVVLNDQLSLAQIVSHFATDVDIEVILHYRLQRPMGA
ncbi:E3 ubiquitin-protein ligase [Aureococcus anophagefferens]|uniref:E3 ubiquitin-protein ligase n=1 Tax=Aureococcus anophagefferens TaxID=44056 RepID=A0ABR1FWN9_AURAN